MSEPQGKTPGHRGLSEAEVALIARIKAHEATFNGLIDQLYEAGADPRQVAIAQTKGEDAYMRAVRAVTRPERLVG